MTAFVHMSLKTVTARPFIVHVLFRTWLTFQKG